MSIFNNSLFLSLPACQKVQVLTADSYRVFEAVLLGPLVLPFPLLLLICSTYCCYILDYTVLVGFLIFLLFVLLQVSGTVSFAWHRDWNQVFKSSVAITTQDDRP